MSTQVTTGLPDVPVVDLGAGVSIPRIGLGTARVDDATARQNVHDALEVGYRFIDTAARYENERGVGAGIADSGLPREELFVSTKLRGAEQGAASTRKALENSLQRLGLDYVDLYLIHWPLPGLGRFVESWNAMEELLAEGKTRAIGVSNFLPEHLDRLAAASDHLPAVNQIELHPYLQQFEQRADNAHRGIVTEAWSPLANDPALLEEPTLLRLGAEYAKTPAQIALRWQVQLGNVTFPKSSRITRLAENLDVFDFELTALDMAAIADLHRGRRVADQDPRTYEEY